MTPPGQNDSPTLFLIITIIMITDACNHNEHIATRVTEKISIYSLFSCAQSYIFHARLRETDMRFAVCHSEFIGAV